MGTPLLSGLLWLPLIWPALFLLLPGAAERADVSVTIVGDHPIDASLAPDYVVRQQVVEVLEVKAKPFLAVDVVVNDSLRVDNAMLGGLPMRTVEVVHTLAEVSPCAAGTFSEDRGGVCYPCSTCAEEEYARSTCLSTRNAVCAACTRCQRREVEICGCTPNVTAACPTGNRFCLPLVGINVVLGFQLRVAVLLTAEQAGFVRELLSTVYAPWLDARFPPEEADNPSSLLRLDVDSSPNVSAATNLTIAFLVPAVYNQTTLRALRALDRDFFLEGALYTFPSTARRRLLGSADAAPSQGQQRRLLGSGLRQLLASNVTFTLPNITVGETIAPTCNAAGNCSGFFENNPLDSCDAKCYAKPCPVGFTGFYGVCEACPANTYKDAPGNASCTLCPPGGLAPNASVNATACLCPPGTYFAGTACLACPANFYCPTLSRADTRTRCPSGRYAWPGSSSADACGCPPNAVSGPLNCSCPDQTLNVSDAGSLGGWQCGDCPAGRTCLRGLLVPLPPTTSTSTTGGTEGPTTTQGPQESTPVPVTPSPAESPPPAPGRHLPSWSTPVAAAVPVLCVVVLALCCIQTRNKCVEKQSKVDGRPMPVLPYRITSKLYRG